MAIRHIVLVARSHANVIDASALFPAHSITAVSSAWNSVVPAKASGHGETNAASSWRSTHSSAGRVSASGAQVSEHLAARSEATALQLPQRRTLSHCGSGAHTAARASCSADVLAGAGAGTAMMVPGHRSSCDAPAPASASGSSVTCCQHAAVQCQAASAHTSNRHVHNAASVALSALIT